MRVVAALVVLAFALACGSGTAAPTWTLEKLEQGDVACYVVLKASNGTETWYDGAFELCPGGPSDATGLIGQSVVADIGRHDVIAPSCEGDPECTEHEEVDFVTALRPAP